MKRVKRNQAEPVQMSSMPQTKSVWQQLLELSAALTVSISLLLLSLNLTASYIYEGNQSLIDLTGLDNTTSLAVGDDRVSNAFNLGFTFDYYGQSFTQARVATNGCLHFKTSGAYCNDYTPDPLTGQHTYTLYPFWTDLIRDNDSQVLAKSFTDKTVFGWYNLREFNRSGSDNSFEVILWTNDTFEFRYGALDIINHDVLIGEIGSSSEVYQYLFHDECNTGTTNIAGTCVSTNWNDTSSNTALENGGSLYGLGSGNGVDCSDPLNDSSCSGYAAAYLTQQCGLDSLHDMACPLYWEAYDDQQCQEDSQYAPFCAGYTQEDSVAFFDDSNVDYGYEEEQHHDGGGYDEDPYAGMVLTDEEWYEIDVEEFGQEQVDEWFGDDLQFNEDGMVDWDSTPHEDYIDIEPLMDVWDIEQEHHEVVTYDLLPIDEVLFINELIIREEIENEIVHEEMERESFETMEELDEWFEEEVGEVEERLEERLAETNEEVTEEIQDNFREEEVHEEREVVEELFAEEDESKPEDERRSSVRISALDVVAGTIRTASNSVSSSSYTSTSSNSLSSSTGSYGASSGTSSGGVSTSNSPSMSDQIASANVQTNQVLSMSTGGESSVGGSTSFSITPMPTLDDSPQVMMADVQVQDMQGEIDTAVSGVMTASEADQVADQIVANNIKEQQEEAEQEQEETGQYADSTTLVAYLGYVAGFDSYKDAQIPQQDTWYEPRAIYAGAILDDNTQAFYGLAGASLNTLGSMISMQPNL
jgi:hypothetical protein